MFPEGTPKHLDLQLSSPLSSPAICIWFDLVRVSFPVLCITWATLNQTLYGLTMFCQVILSLNNYKLHSLYILAFFTLSVQDLPLWRCIKEIQRNLFKEIFNVPGALAITCCICLLPCGENVCACHYSNCLKGLSL